MPSHDRRIAFVQSTWHESVVEHCRSSFLEKLVALGIPESDVDIFRVPGAFEAPLLARRAALSGRYDAVVVSALVVDGGIYRHDFVAHSVVDALMRIQLETDVPVISAVLTPHHFHEHKEHIEYFKHHFEIKGEEAATACVGALATLDDLALTIGS
jgi:6,7-dimethyl-8-ribityllumazine synthase